MTDDPRRAPEDDWDGKTLGAAAAEDDEKVDDLLAETGGDVEEAERRFEAESAESEIGQTRHHPAE